MASSTPELSSSQEDAQQLLITSAKTNGSDDKLLIFCVLNLSLDFSEAEITLGWLQAGLGF